MIAARQGQTAMISLLVKSGAEINMLDQVRLFHFERFKFLDSLGKALLQMLVGEMILQSSMN